GVRPIFQLQVPSAPAAQADGSIVAGNLRIFVMQPATYRFVKMDATEFQRGYRIELMPTAGCAFDVELHAGSSSTPAPTPTTPPPPAAPTPAPAPSPSPASDPTEPIWNEQFGTVTRVKSPAPHMHFTAGAPLRLLADVHDDNAWRCPPGHPPYVCPGTEERYY